MTRRFRPSILGLVTVAAALCVAAAGFRWAPRLLAAAVLMATWGAFGLAAVGAVCGRRERRAAYLGAFLFGSGVLLFVFGPDPEAPNWPRIEADRTLNALRRRFPSFVGESTTLPHAAAMNRRIEEVLDRPVPLHFPEYTPLEDFMKSIQEKTRGPDGFVIPVFMEPDVLERDGPGPGPGVEIDLDGVPLRTALRLALHQLGDDYTVGEGVLVIKRDENSYGFLRAVQDPFLVVGHCLLALLASAVGGALGPLAGGRGR